MNASGRSTYRSGTRPHPSGPTSSTSSADPQGGRQTTVTEIESRLRSWLLRELKIPLSTLSYTELRLIAEGKREEARRLHARGLNTLTPPRF